MMKQTLVFLLINCFGLLIACKTDPETTTTTTTNSTQDSIQNISQNNQPSNNSTNPVAEKEAFDIIPEGIYRDLNAKLAASNKKRTAKEIVQMYYPAEISDETSFEKIKVQTEKKGTQTIVTLTHDNQSEHILIQGHRIVMTLEPKDAHWQIVSLQQQYKCWIRKEGGLWSNDKCS
jgi:hypothetical protein